MASVPTSSTNNDAIAKAFRGTKPLLPTEDLNIVEWDHMDLKKFYPMSLGCTWTIRTALYPFNVVKSRLQLQKQKTVYRSTWNAFANIARYEGIRGLYKGFWVTVPQISASFIYSTIYEKLRSVLQYDCGISSVHVISAIAGGTAAFFGEMVFVPTDIISQHMMINNYAEKFTGKDQAIVDELRKSDGKGTLGWRVVKAVYKCDGLAGFYRGFWASTWVYAPSCFIFWPTYYVAQDGLKWLHNDKSFLLADQAMAAMLGGAVSSVCTNPMEVYRIRIQVHRDTYKATLQRMLREEGRQIFTKGLSPRVISNSIYSGVIMVGYEVVKRFCVLPEYRHAVKW